MNLMLPFHVIGDMFVHVALYVYAFCCSDVVAEIYHLFQHVHERLVSQVTVKYKHYLIELATSQQQVRLIDRTVRALTAPVFTICSIAAAAFCAERDWSTVCACFLNKQVFSTMHKGLAAF